MPKTNIDYSKTIIYKIVCNDINVVDLYVGFTSDFTRRKANHKNSCINQLKSSYNTKIYKTIRDNGNWINWTMVEIEKYPCNDSNEAHARERHWYETLKASLNSNKPIRYHEEFINYHKDYQKEYYENNKDELIKYQKEYYENNKDELIKYQKEYYENNKEYQKKYYENNKDELIKYHKEYYKNNKDELIKYQKEYYKNNKDELIKYQKEYQKNIKLH
jgi:hypothetical protein